MSDLRTAHHESPLLQVEALACLFPVSRGAFRRKATLRALDGVSFELHAGEIYGLVGESGCGKSTLGKILAGIVKPSSGRILFSQHDLATLRGRQRHATLKDLQYVYQDPAASLNPRRTIRAALHEPLLIHTALDRTQREQLILDLIRSVGLAQAHLDRYPHELSGGQQRRVGLARILVLRPRIVILDEPTAGVDLSIQAYVLDLLLELRSKFNLTYILISHDLRVVESVSDRVGVMYLGRIVEESPARALFAAPRHPYTKSLFNALPVIGGPRVLERVVLEGEAISPLSVPQGCRFTRRCPIATEQCSRMDPMLLPLGPGRVACHYPLVAS